MRVLNPKALCSALESEGVNLSCLFSMTTSFTYCLRSSSWDLLLINPPWELHISSLGEQESIGSFTLYCLKDSSEPEAAQSSGKVKCRSSMAAAFLYVTMHVAGTGLRATRRWGNRSQHHCLLLRVATVWCVMQLCGGTVSALIRLAGRNPYTYRAHVETEHCWLNLHWEKTITVERMPCLFRNLPAVNIHYANCCKVLIEQWIWLWYAVMLLLCICIYVQHKGLSTIAWPRPLQTNPSV